MKRYEMVTITMPRICAQALLDAFFEWMSNHGPLWDQETFGLLEAMRDNLRSAAGDPIQDYQR